MQCMYYYKLTLHQKLTSMLNGDGGTNNITILALTFY